MKLSFEGNHGGTLTLTAELNSRQDIDRVVSILNHLSFSLWPYRDPQPRAAIPERPDGVSLDEWEGPKEEAPTRPHPGVVEEPF